MRYLIILLLALVSCSTDDNQTDCDCIEYRTIEVTENGTTTVTQDQLDSDDCNYDGMEFISHHNIVNGVETIINSRVECQ